MCVVKISTVKEALRMVKLLVSSKQSFKLTIEYQEPSVEEEVTDNIAHGVLND